jgi:endogenous inhibitor of DNA gyrase (YacG/DUF329 family)
MTASCPTCGKSAADKHSPFCSSRCAHTDLGRWLSGQYAVPAEEKPDDADLEALEKAVIDASEDGTLVTGRFRRDA